MLHKLLQGNANGIRAIVPEHVKSTRGVLNVAIHPLLHKSRHAVRHDVVCMAGLEIGKLFSTTAQAKAASSFEELPLMPQLVEALHAAALMKPTEIQVCNVVLSAWSGCCIAKDSCAMSDDSPHRDIVLPVQHLMTAHTGILISLMSGILHPLLHLATSSWNCVPALLLAGYGCASDRVRWRLPSCFTDRVWQDLGVPAATGQHAQAAGIRH